MSLRSPCYLSAFCPQRLAAHGRRTGLLGCGLQSAWRQRGAADGGHTAECSKPVGGGEDSEDVTSGEDVRTSGVMTDTNKNPIYGI